MSQKYVSLFHIITKSLGFYCDESYLKLQLHLFPSCYNIKLKCEVTV